MILESVLLVLDGVASLETCLEIRYSVHASGFIIKFGTGNMDFENTYDTVVKQTVETRRRL